MLFLELSWTVIVYKCEIIEFYEYPSFCVFWKIAIPAKFFYQTICFEKFETELFTANNFANSSIGN